MKKLLRRLPLILFALAIVGGIVYGFVPKPVPVDLRPVTRGSMKVTIDEDGRTRVKQQYIVTTPVAGFLKRVELKAGAELGPSYMDKKPLAVLLPAQPPLMTAKEKDAASDLRNAADRRLKKAQTELKETEEARKKADEEYRRIDHAYRSGSSSRQELADTELKLLSWQHKWAASKFAVQIAEFELKQAETQLRSYLKPANGEEVPIYSPVDQGKVLRVMRESEGVVPAGTEILVVADTNYLEAEIDVLTQSAVKIRGRKGPNDVKVELVNWGGKKIDGKINRRESGFLKISALGVEEQRVNVIVDFEVPEVYQGQLGDGYRIEARFVIAELDDVVIVPSGAVFRQGDAKAVYVAEEGRAVLRKVTIGQDNGVDAQVLEGLKAGEEVVLHPGDKVKDGIRIEGRE